MKPEPLSSLVNDVNQCNPETLGRPQIAYIDISSVENSTKQLMAPQRIAADAAPGRARQVVRTHDVLVSTVRPNLNAVALVPMEFNGEIASTGFCVLRAQPKKLSPQYLFYFTQSAKFVTHLTAIATGASYPAVTDNDILDTCIPLPEISEQQRIARQLEQADQLRRTRRYALELTDTFLPAAFLELFGDPISNVRGWATEILDDCCEQFIDYRGRTPEYSTEGIPHVTAACIKEHEIQWAAARYVTEATYVAYMTRGLPVRGDVILTTEAPLGESAVIKTDDRFSMAQRLLLIRPGPSVLPDYLCYLLSHRSFRPRLLQFATGSTVKGISSESFRAIPIALPPLPIQQKFAALVERVEHLRAVQRESLRQAEHLFASLLHRAFSG